MAQGHNHFGRVGVADLNIDVLVVLAVDHDLKAQVLGQLLYPGQLSGLAVALISIVFGIRHCEGIFGGDRSRRSFTM